MAFDPKCLELARHFLRGCQIDAVPLAQHIQDSVTKWLLRASLDAAEPRAVRPQSLARERYEQAWHQKQSVR